MLIQLIGRIQLERIEDKIDPGTMNKFKSVLGQLKKRRDSEAHTHLRGTTTTIDAPSKTIKNFHDVYTALICFEKEIRKI